MTINLKVGLIIVSLVLFIITFILLKKEKIPVRYSLIWFFASLVILFVGIIPDIFLKISKLLGFVTMSNMVIGIFIFMMLLISILFTVILSKHMRKITLLTQEVSLLKEKVSKYEK